jgi:hypothetical protein
MAKRSNIVKPHPDAVEALKELARAGPHIAHGFRPKKALNLVFKGGRTLHALQFKNFYLGHWSRTDMTNIDGALAGALTDVNLNHVIQQYFDDKPITSVALQSAHRADPSLTSGVTFDRDAVHRALAALHLNGIDLQKTIICLYLPPGVILDTHAADGVGNEKGKKRHAGDDKDSSLEGLGGYHGSAHVNGRTVYFAVAVYSQIAGHEINGIPLWPDPWKNIAATMYHELNEARTDPDVEEAIRTGNDKLLGWYSDADGEIGDIPMTEAGRHLGLVMVEVPLVAGGTAPIQLMWSNAIGGPCGPF